jgi:valyl-tRNA synthetase
LLQSLEGALRLLHPFMPFVTEEVWQRLPRREGDADSIMISPYPAPRSLLDAEAEAEMDAIMRAIEGARSARGDVNLPPNQAVPLVLVPRDAAAQRLFERHRHAFTRLANASEVRVFPPGAPRPGKAVVHVEPEVEVHLPLAGLIDFGAEKARVEKELQKLEGELAGIAKRLDNPGFLARAPAEVVDKDRARAAELHERRDKLTRHLERVTRAEDGMNEQMSGGNGGDGEEKPGQGHRGADQMGTHGGPSRGGGNGGRGEGPHSDPSAPGRPSGGGYGGHETSGHPGSSSQAEAEKDQPAPGEREGMASQAASRVKSLARGLMEKAADVIETGIQTAEEKFEEVAPKIQERFKAARKPAKSSKPARSGGKKKAAKAGGRKKVAAKSARKPARGGKKKAAKAGRAKAGRARKSSSKGSARRKKSRR